MDVIASKANLSTLQVCKAVSRAWRKTARRALTNVAWLLEEKISLHVLVKTGHPSPRLAMALGLASPRLLQERDEEGLLVLQYVAAYRKDPLLIAAIREATVKVVPGLCPAFGAEARTIKHKLRPVRTRIRQAPIAAA